MLTASGGCPPAAMNLSPLLTACADIPGVSFARSRTLLEIWQVADLLARDVRSDLGRACLRAGPRGCHLYSFESRGDFRGRDVEIECLTDSHRHRPRLG